MVLSGTKDHVREVVKELLQRLKAATDWLVGTLIIASLWRNDLFPLARRVTGIMSKEIFTIASADCIEVLDGHPPAYEGMQHNFSERGKQCSQAPAQH